MLQSPLHVASLTAQSRVVRQLVVAGATVDLRNKFGNTALHVACENGDLEVAKSILKPISPCEIVEAQLEHYRPQIQGCNLMDMVHDMNYAGEC
jgi:ankyrin only family protein